MYYLCDKTKSNIIPTYLDYEFSSFDDFYSTSKILTNKLIGTYTIKIVCEDLDAIKSFIKVSEEYNRMTIFILTSDTILQRVVLSQDNINMLSAKSSKKLWEELIVRTDVYFEKGVADKVFWNIDKKESVMSTVLLDLKEAYGRKIISFEDVLKVVSIEEIVYPKSVMYSYLMMDRFRASKLRKSVEVLGNDIVFYSIRKNIRKVYDEKAEYYRTGIGSDRIKQIPFKNIIKMLYAFTVLPKKFKDVTIILKLYEKGEYINDYIQG